MTDPADGDRRRSVQSAEVALAVLAALGRASGPVALGDLAAAVGLAPAKAHRYLVSLIAAGMAVQRGDGAYDLGPEAARLGLAAVARIDPVNRAADALPGLVAETGCTAMLSVWGPAGPTVVRWEKADPQLITALGVGAVLPPATSATGLVFLAWLPPRLLGGLTAPQVDGVRRAGVARISGSYIPGLHALAAPVFDLTGGLAAVVTLVTTQVAQLEGGETALRRLSGQAPSSTSHRP